MITELSHNLDLKQEQQLVMTPKLQQAIELLQLSTLELNEYLQKEMMENPLLSLEGDYSNQSGSYLPSEQSEGINYENFISKELTLEEKMMGQLGLVFDNDLDRNIGKYIIANLDESGFFNDFQSVTDNLNVSRASVERVLDKIQGLEPIGVATAGVREFLYLQLEELKGVIQDNNIILAQQIVCEYLDQLSANKLRLISKGLKLEIAYVQKLVDLIRNLKTTPRESFTNNHKNNYLDPDIIIKKIGDRFEIIMNKESFPVLRINKYYQKLLKEKNDSKYRSYIEKKLNSALWLIKSIEQRRETIYSIVKDIVDFQLEFLNSGIKYLIPMTMQEVADRVEVHESTVSRATKNKYIQTPYGLFPLKFFFNEGVKSKDGRVSAIAVREEIKEIIAGEDKNKPLSDQKIKEILEKKGIYISRRTIAKYRAELKIPASRMRKRYD
ncbi:RNA polymerase RpoN-/SigL-like sigma 54 subunit [Orenia metallireducens]|uniref:RNA polymerase, sigma 54 subunit, RpoN/SigL n=1 Tax=Orenia metallireducens TaxID=1413210 RepID=A0A285I882_9FIRM|nr:RNA polymerase factor sigma-54 [Orenia metallireducens]PRX22386.1 RNA polymerase RpoN-/SigL-like sigma 54 subunit [Orenia metallireducens]SNY44027.1 RNA polymerase, sigma 54 subunit, RpoN/SigL [Orenia metallireducens]